MRTPPPALLPFLRSNVQGDVLAHTYLNPESEFSITELATRSGASVNAVQREVDRLVTSGLLSDRRRGTERLVRSNPEHLLAEPLTELLARTYGPRPVLAEKLQGLTGLEQAFIYGSWAARYSGDTGSVPHDVDVLAIGSVDADDLEERARAAEGVLHREVNIRRVRPADWAAKLDPFISHVAEGPLVELAITPSQAMS